MPRQLSPFLHVMAELYAANSTMVECIYLHQLAQFLMGSELEVRQRLFLDSSSAKFVVQRSGVGKLKHVEIKHMFLQQLLRRGIFTIHKIPTRVNPADLNTKKLSVERRKLLGTLCGLYPICAQDKREEEVLITRRVQRNMANRLVQALQVVSMSLLQGCSNDLSGHDLQDARALRGGGVLHGPVQALSSSLTSWWTMSTWWSTSTTSLLAATMVAVAISAVLVSMVPRRGRGRQQGGRGVQRSLPEQEPEYITPSDAGDSDDQDRVHRLPDDFSPRAQAEVMRDEEAPRGRHEDNRAMGSRDRPGDGYERRSRSSRRTSEASGQEDPSNVLHRKLALMFATLVEGTFVPRETVTYQGMVTTLQHILAACRSLEDGYYLTISDALGWLDTDQELLARDNLNQALRRCEQRYGSLPGDAPTLSRYLLRRYRSTLREAGYPVLRLEEMVEGPSEAASTLSSTEEHHRPFRSDASRSHTSEEFVVETDEDRVIRYRAISLGSASDPDLWMRVNHFGSEGEERDEASMDSGNYAEPDSEPSLSGEGPDFVPGPFLAIIQRLTREAAQQGERRPEGAVREPLTYPPLQEDELQGVGYPGAGVNLAPYSNYERVTRMIECYNARLVECEYHNDPEEYENILREIERLEDLQVLADDVRPNEMANLLPEV